jgi:hypothetical protein
MTHPIWFYNGAIDPSFWESKTTLALIVACMMGVVSAVVFAWLYENLCIRLLKIENFIEENGTTIGVVSMIGAAIGMTLTLYVLVEL